jgi:hypothetical protein
VDARDERGHDESDIASIGIRLSRNNVIECRRSSTIGNARQLDAGAALEQFAGEMWPPCRGRCKRDLARTSFGVLLPNAAPTTLQDEVGSSIAVFMVSMLS